MIGLGTQLDTARFRSLIAEALKLPPTQVTALILGEHGDSMVPIWSAAQVAGLPLEKFPGWNAAQAEALFTRTKGSGAEVIKLKGGRRLRRRPVDPRSGPRHRARPEADPAGLVARQRRLRHPRRLHLGADGRRPQGVEAQLEIELWPKEVSALAALGARCCARRSTRSSRAIPRRPASPTPRPRGAKPASSDRREHAAGAGDDGLGRTGNGSAAVRG